MQLAMDTAAGYIEVEGNEKPGAVVDRLALTYRGLDYWPWPSGEPTELSP